jgi:hypothetical protein
LRAAGLAVAIALCACGYGLSQRYVARGGAERIHVRTFQNLSTEPELGAAVTASLRTELSRRGADAPASAPATIEGDVRAGEPAPASLARDASGRDQLASWRIGIEVRARLVAQGATVAEHAARRETIYLAGADPLETEGRRAVALRRLADEAAREVLRAFER